MTLMHRVTGYNDGYINMEWRGFEYQKSCRHNRPMFLLVWTIQRRPIRWKLQFFFIKALTPCSVPVISGEVAQVDQRCSLHVGPTAAPQTNSATLPHYLPTKKCVFPVLWIRIQNYLFRIQNDLFRIRQEWKSRFKKCISNFRPVDSGL